MQITETIKEDPWDRIEKGIDYFMYKILTPLIIVCGVFLLYFNIFIVPR